MAYLSDVVFALVFLQDMERILVDKRSQVHRKKEKSCHRFNTRNSVEVFACYLKLCLPDT